MRRDFRIPRASRVLQRGVRVETGGDRLVDGSLPPFCERPDQLLLLLNECIKLGRLRIQESYDRNLLLNRRDRNQHISSVIPAKVCRAFPRSVTQGGNIPGKCDMAKGIRVVMGVIASARVANRTHRGTLSL